MANIDDQANPMFTLLRDMNYEYYLSGGNKKHTLTAFLRSKALCKTFVIGRSFLSHICHMDMRILDLEKEVQKNLWQWISQLPILL